MVSFFQGMPLDYSILYQYIYIYQYELDLLFIMLNIFTSLIILRAHCLQGL